jgi:hypothetical protein
MDATSKQLRQEAQAHANAVGRAIDVMCYVTLKRMVVIKPRPATWITGRLPLRLPHAFPKQPE